MWLTVIVSWPIGKLLDCLLHGEDGEHNRRFKKHELRWLLQQHVTEALEQTRNDIQINIDNCDKSDSEFSQEEENGQTGLNDAQFKIFKGAIAV
jgi:hypothetical protein